MTRARDISMALHPPSSVYAFSGYNINGNRLLFIKMCFPSALRYEGVVVETDVRLRLCLHSTEGSPSWQGAR
jgi:hypothetical protein